MSGAGEGSRGLAAGSEALAPASPRDRGAIRRTLVQAGFLLLLVVAWHFATAGGAINRIFLPAPGDVWREGLGVLTTSEFLTDLATTLVSVVVAFAIAVALGVAAGALLGRNRFAYDVAEPILSGIFAIPLIIFFPLVLLLVGIGPASKVVFAAFSGFFPVALSTMSGFATVERRYVIYAETLGASRVQLARRLLIPAALPQILSGLRISFVVTFASVIAGEMIASLHGLGHALNFFSEIMEPAKMFALIVVVILLTGVANVLLSSLARNPRP